MDLWTLDCGPFGLGLKLQFTSSTTFPVSSYAPALFRIIIFEILLILHSSFSNCFTNCPLLEFKQSLADGSNIEWQSLKYPTSAGDRPASEGELCASAQCSRKSPIYHSIKCMGWKNEGENTYPFSNYLTSAIYAKSRLPNLHA